MVRILVADIVADGDSIDRSRRLDFQIPSINGAGKEVLVMVYYKDKGRVKVGSLTGV